MSDRPDEPEHPDGAEPYHGEPLGAEPPAAEHAPRSEPGPSATPGRRTPPGFELEPVPWTPPDASSPDTVEILATIPKRVTARILTWLFWTIVTALVLLGLYGPQEDAGEELTQSDIPIGVVVAVWIVPTLIDVVLVGRSGWDPGKLMLGLRVVDARDRPPGVPAAFVRTVVVQAAQLLAIVPLVGVLASWLLIPWVLVLIWSMATGPDRQGWQDRAAGTWVVQRRRARPLAATPGDDGTGGDGPAPDDRAP